MTNRRAGSKTDTDNRRQRKRERERNERRRKKRDRGQVKKGEEAKARKSYIWRRSEQERRGRPLAGRAMETFSVR